MQSLLAESRGDVEKFKMLLEKWFEDTMERATGWYKRYTQYILFIIGFLIAVSFNVETITIAKKLAADPKLAAQVANSASVFIEQQKETGNQLRQLKSQGLDTTEEYAAIKQDYDSLKQKTDTLIATAKALVNNDIKSVNEVLGLGYECDHPRFLADGSVAAWTRRQVHRPRRRVQPLAGTALAAAGRLDRCLELVVTDGAVEDAVADDEQVRAGAAKLPGQLLQPLNRIPVSFLICATAANRVPPP